MHFAGLRREAYRSVRLVRLVAIFAILGGTGIAAEQENMGPAAAILAKIKPTQDVMAEAREELSDLRKDLESTQKKLAKAEEDLAKAEEDLIKAAEEELQRRQQEAAGEQEEESFMDKLKSVAREMLPAQYPGVRKKRAEERVAKLEKRVVALHEAIEKQHVFIARCETTIKQLETKADYVEAKTASDAASSQLQFHESQANKMKIRLQEVREDVRSLTKQLGDLREENAPAADQAAVEQSLRAAEKEAVSLYKQIDYHQYSAVTQVKQAERLHELTEKRWMAMRETGASMEETIQVPGMAPVKVEVEEEPPPPPEPDVTWQQPPPPEIPAPAATEPPHKSVTDETPSERELDEMGAMDEDPAMVGGKEVREGETWKDQLMWPFRKIGQGCVWLKDQTVDLFSSDEGEPPQEQAPDEESTGDDS